jgi:1-acylglycerone phosphate reductase
MERRTVRTVLITGCSDGGLGASLAAAFHKQRGYRVFGTARNVDKMANLVSLGIEILELDVTSEQSIAACVEKVSAMTHGTLDVLVNNAGAAYNIPMLDASIPELYKQFELNVFGPIRVVQAFFPLLRKSTAATKLLVNHTSSAPSVTMPFFGPYRASKIAMSAFSESLRLELQPFDIKVIDLKTGGIKTHFFDNVKASALTNTSTSLPAASPYLPGKDKIEHFMREGMPQEGSDPDDWARQVVSDLSKHDGRNAPHQIWRGKSASQAWLADTVIPVGWLDGIMKKASGFDIAEKLIRGAEKQEASQ